ncbi:MAG: class I SAM-dependent methyltransferase [Gammaproteobacteria bacterium]|nr:class I SAM-dependent methyltransferase [Gammaproteobacteria bacterium]
MTTQRKEMIEQTFDTVASGYDHSALSFFPHTAEAIVNILKQSIPTDESTSQNNDIKILDVCTGTGVVALHAAKTIPHSEIIGIDLSSGMLKMAQKKVDRDNLKNICFHQQDLEALTYPAQSFDAISCSFGLFFIDDMVAALKNLKTLLKPGGQLIISSFTQDAFEPYSSLFLSQYEAFGQEVPPLSWLRLSSVDQLKNVFNDADFDMIDINEVSLGSNIHSSNEWWDIVWNAGYRGLYNQIPLDKQEEFKKCHLKEIQNLCDNNQSWMDTSYYVTVATIK